VFSTTLFSCDTQLQGKAIVENQIQTLGTPMTIPQKIDTLIGDTIIPKKPERLLDATTGVLQMKYITQGNITPIVVEDTHFTEVVEAKIDTPKIENKYDKVGEVIFIDSVATKAKDTANCSKKIYY
jgi:hypothetical protein